MKFAQNNHPTRLFGPTRLFDTFEYRKVASSNMPCLEAHTGFSSLLMKGIFNPYVL